jgi:hypothetical protein
MSEIIESHSSDGKVKLADIATIWSKISEALNLVMVTKE